MKLSGNLDNGTGNQNFGEGSLTFDLSRSEAKIRGQGALTIKQLLSMEV